MPDPFATSCQRSRTVAREDVVLFINACFACTRQNEFYSDAAGQAVSIEFLHDYILGNYRRLYARTLAVGINHFNTAMVVERLLRTGADTPDDVRAEEGDLIRAALRELPPQRVFGLFRRLARSRVNNRRTRAVIRDYVRSRPDAAFDAVKYRNKLSRAASHAHLDLPGEVGSFLFEREAASYETPLFESFRQAHYSQAAVYELPFSVAEGFAQKHSIPRHVFLERIEPRLTEGERLRLQRSAARANKGKGVNLDIDLGRAPLTKLCLYALSLPPEEREARRSQLDTAMVQAAERAIARRAGRGDARLHLGKVACILDRSYSSSGSSEKRRRPLAVALGASYLLRAAAEACRLFWTPPLTWPTDASRQQTALDVVPRGQTNLADPVLDALEWGAELVVLVSDGYENDPPGTVARVVEAYRRDLDRERRVSFVHANPVFDSESFEPKTLGPSIPTVGMRSAEDLPTMLAFARFVDGGSNLDELESYLRGAVEELLR